MDNLIKALTILRKYGNPAYPTYCEHDVLYVDIPYDAVSDEDKGELITLGFIRDDLHNCFKSYRYGSA